MFKFSLKPREDRFFVLLQALAGQAQQSAGHLQAFINSTDTEQKAEAMKAMAAVRAEAKATSFEITRRLCQTFITPFDREDIQDLSDDLYVIPKIIEKVASRVRMYDLGKDKSDFARQIGVIVQEAAATKDMVRALTGANGASEIMKHVTALRELENQGDKVRNDLLEHLFSEVSDARALILRKDVYDMLEKVIDRYRDAANVALKIVLKYS